MMLVGIDLLNGGKLPRTLNARAVRTRTSIKAKRQRPWPLDVGSLVGHAKPPAPLTLTLRFHVAHVPCPSMMSWMIDSIVCYIFTKYIAASSTHGLWRTFDSKTPSSSLSSFLLSLFNRLYMVFCVSLPPSHR